MNRYRKTKFRAWVKSKKCFAYGGFSIHATSGGIISDWYKPDDLEVCQFTGIQDSRGEDIYEGDIVFLAGLGDTEITFPFWDLYDAVAEKDIGEIKGHVFES